MEPIPPLDPSAARLLRTMRELRFASGLQCPRCESRTVVLWGRAHGRQRYRCRECRRTFSDLTFTVMYRTKRLASWPAYLRCMQSVESVRAAARVAEVHPSTAFRWRHSVLSYACWYEEPRLGGLVELTSMCIRYSSKGQRHSASGRRRRAYVRLVFARDRGGRSFASRGGRADLCAYDAVFGEGDIAPDAHVITDGRRLSGPALFGRLRCAGCTHSAPHRYGTVPLGAPLAHVGNVAAESRRFLAWLGPFHGVASWYLDHYLRWHRLLDGAQEWWVVTEWLQATSPPPTLPANMTYDAAPS